MRTRAWVPVSKVFVMGQFMQISDQIIRQSNQRTTIWITTEVPLCLGVESCPSETLFALANVTNVYDTHEGLMIDATFENPMLKRFRFRSEERSGGHDEPSSRPRSRY